MNRLVSIIIPVYKVEAYIEKCMQSLLDQTYTNFEALIVDDGSPDNSIQLAKAKVGDDPRFIFFEKENGGQGTARNLGLDRAKGDYIAFLDSDDYYEDNYLSVMLEEIVRKSTDICVCNVRNVSITGDELSVRENNIDLYYKNRDYLMARGYVSNYMWDKLFKASCFEGVRFDPKVRTYEDVHLLFRVIYGKKITSTDAVLYNYVQRPGSTMNSLPKTYIDDRYAVYVSVCDFYKKELEGKGEAESLLRFFFINNFIFICSSNIAKYSERYSDDITTLISKDTMGYFSAKEILLNNFFSAKVKFLLLVLKVNPQAYRLLLNFRRGLKGDLLT